MFRCKFYLICVVAILCISLCVGSFHPKKCPETDKQALLKLKDGFVHGRHILSSWNGGDCCKWKGISCNNLTGHVTRLELLFSEYNLSDEPGDVNDPAKGMRLIISNVSGALGGKIDSSICELRHLTILYLSLNKLEGEIPKCIGSLGQLIELNLAQNELVGSIPQTLANLSNLQNLELGLNYLVVNDLEWLSHLSNLRYLVLSFNDLSRAIDWPSSISKIPSLVQLSLIYCELPQVNPKSILHMNSSTSLQILSLAGNNFNSSILSWVPNVSKVLTFLDLSYNGLEVSVVKSFETLCQFKDLRYLSLEHNPFSNGSLPDFSQFSSLKTLFLENASIVGPLSFDHLPDHLEYLDLSSNHLSGSIPEFEVTKFASLVLLGLSRNQLTGTLPYAIGKLTNLNSLYLNSNKLNGVISEAHLLNLSRLEALEVSRNSLHFNMHPNWVPPFQLQLLYASSCIMGPQFPTWLKYQRNLDVLDISNSSIIDSFPKWIWDISSSLKHLNVSHNKLGGVLPESLSGIKIKPTTTWDFSFNNLSGPLPPFPPKTQSISLK